MKRPDLMAFVITMVVVGIVTTILYLPTKEKSSPSIWMGTEMIPFKIGRMTYYVIGKPGYSPFVVNYSLDSIKFEHTELELKFMQEFDTEEKNSK